MKHLVTLVCALLITTSSFAQKSKLSAAKAAYDDGDFKTAYTNINDASQNDKTKDLPETWVYKAQILSMVKSSPQVAEILGITVGDDELEATLEKAKQLDTDNAFKDQISEASAVIIQNTHNQGVVAFNENKDYQTAIDTFEREIAFRQKYAPELGIDTVDYLIIGYSAFELDNNEKGVQSYEKLVDLGYNDVGVYYTLLNNYEDNGQDDQYLALLKKAKEKFPNENNFALLEIDYYIKNGQINDVLDDMIAESEKNPTNVNLLLTISSVYESKEDYVNQYKYAKKAYDVDPNNFPATLNVGVSTFNQALAYNTEMNFMKTDTSPEYNAAKAKRDELANQALPYFQKAFELDPKNKNVLMALIQYNKLFNNQAEVTKYQNAYDAVQ